MADSADLETHSICPHTKFRPLDQPPKCRYTCDPSCNHCTPLYYLGWLLPFEHLREYYPESKGDILTFWDEGIIYPWIEVGYDVKYKSKIYKNRRYKPKFECMTYKKDCYIVVYITDNNTQESIDLAFNKEYVEDATRMAKVKENFGEMQWIRNF
ncbi:hypothetical protein EV361DRAFT_914088 [Lentinula raphanica]|nr:hypothetical protein EV361DRAFT_914088 [Lentinula raphanica]